MNTFDTWEWSETFIDASYRVRLVAQIIYEKFINPDHSTFKWKYVNYLDEGGNLPCSWEFEELVNLSEWAGDPMLFNDKLEKFEAEYEEFQPLMQKAAPNCKECRSEEAFIWAEMAVLSRSFKITYDNYSTLFDIKSFNNEPTPGYAMIPVLDIVNHSNFFGYDGNLRAVKIDASRRAKDVGENYLMSTMEPVEAGQEIFWEYRDDDNLPLLWSYGFVILKNQYQWFVLEADNGTKDCPQEATKSRPAKGCWFKTYPGVFNQGLLRYLSKSSNQ